VCAGAELACRSSGCIDAPSGYGSRQARQREKGRQDHARPRVRRRAVRLRNNAPAGSSSVPSRPPRAHAKNVGVGAARETTTRSGGVKDLRVGNPGAGKLPVVVPLGRNERPILRLRGRVLGSSSSVAFLKVQLYYGVGGC
jgi:hypothetical protein